MTRQHITTTAKPDVSKLTISTWVYIGKKSVDAQAAVAETLDDHIASKAVRRRIPIMEFGNSIEPRVGIGINISMTWEGYLGFFWCGCLINMPAFPEYLCSYWIGGEGMTKDGWFRFADGGARPSVDPVEGWENARFVFFGIAASWVGTAFGYPQNPSPFPIVPAVKYEGFDDTGVREFYVRNDGPAGPHFTLNVFTPRRALPMSWTFSGEIRVNFAPTGRVSVKEGDIAKESLHVNSEMFFESFWGGPLVHHVYPTPTPNVGGDPILRVDSGPGTGVYYAVGDLVVVFPELPNVTYGKPAIPSTLFIEGDTVKMLITGRWPEETTTADQEIVPTITFSAGGFKVDSWNHIFFTVDLSTMILAGGQDDKEKMVWVETIFGPALARAGLAPPYMEKPPKWAMFVNNKRSRSEPEAQLTVYPKKGEHWATSGQPGVGSNSHITMALGTLAGGGSGADSAGSIGFPIIPQEKGRWKTTGPNRNTKYAYTHIWLDQYIDPSTKNLNKFVWKSKNKAYNFVIPNPNKKLAASPPGGDPDKSGFGKPDVWFYRDKEGEVEWKNLGKTGSFQNTGTKPQDFRPGPGQPKRTKKTT